MQAARSPFADSGSCCAWAGGYSLARPRGAADTPGAFERRPESTRAAALPHGGRLKTPQHDRLASLAGEWTTVYRVVSAPGKPPLEMPGRASYRVTLGGYWVIGETELMVGPRSVKGLLIYGFDTYKQRCSFQFIQESDTQVLFGLGVPNALGDDITFDVPMELAPGQPPVNHRTTLRFESSDRHVFAMARALPEGGELTVLTIEYTRAK